MAGAVQKRGTRIRARPTRKDVWTSARREAFLDYLMTSFDVGEAARAAGVDPTSAWRLRCRDAEFAARWAAARQTAYDVIEAALLTQAIGSSTGGSIEMEDEAGPAAGRARILDAALALKLLARRDAADRAAKSRAGAAVARTRGMNAAVPIAQVQAELLKRIAMIERRTAQTGAAVTATATATLVPPGAPLDGATVAAQPAGEGPA